MNYATTSFLMASPQPSTVNDIIVRNKDGVDIKQSLQNVSAMATTWHKNSTRELYAVLGQCYELYYLIETADSSQRDKYRDNVKGAYAALVGVQGANTLLSRIVSVVFNFVGSFNHAGVATALTPIQFSRLEHHTYNTAE